MLPRNLLFPLGAFALVSGGFALGWLCRPTTTLARSDRAIVTGKAAPPTPRAVPVINAPASSQQRLAAAIRVVHQAPDRATRLYQFALRLRDLDVGQYPGVLEAVRNSRSPDAPELLAMVCSLWAAQNGPAAFAAARALVSSDGEHGALHSAIAAWAQRDPAAAQAALTEAGFARLDTDEMTAFAEGWAAVNPVAAETLLRQATSGNSSDEDIPAAVRRGFEAIARARIDMDPAAALTWYASLPAPLAERTRQAFAAKLAAVDPQLASQWLARDDSAQLGASDVLPVLRGLRLDSFDGQFAWANGAANPATRESALMAVVRENAPERLLPLGEWLAAHADDAALAPAFSAYAQQVVRKSPTAAVTWAMSLDQPQLRQTALATVATEWVSINPRAAHEWVQRTGLVDWESILR